MRRVIRFVNTLRTDYNGNVALWGSRPACPGPGTPPWRLASPSYHTTPYAGRPGVDTGGRKNSCLLQTRYDTKVRDRDHIDSRNGHGTSQAYDPVATGELRLVYCIQNPDSREENCHAHRITNAVPNIAFSTDWFCILYGIYSCYLLLRGRFRAEWICSSRAKSSCHILPESRGKRLGI